MITNSVSFSRAIAAGGGSMKALPNLRTSTTRRRLRSLLPSAMMGLVTFSFTLLFVGAAAYTVSLPSLMKDPEGKSFVLLDAAGRTAGSSASGMWTSLFRQMMFGEDAAGGGSSETCSGTGAGFAGSMTGISLSGLMNTTVADAEAKKDEADAGQTPGSDADKTDPAPSAPDTPSKPDEGKDDTGKDDGKDDGKEDQPDDGLSAEDRKFREWMLGRLARVDEIAVEVNGLTEAFNRDAINGSLTVRKEDAAKASSVASLCYSEWVKTLNGYLTPQGSKLSLQKGQLISMYRNLYYYSGTLEEAWSININFEDPSQHVDTFMTPLTQSMGPNGQNKYLTEYSTKRQGFSL